MSPVTGAGSRTAGPPGIGQHAPGAVPGPLRIQMLGAFHVTVGDRTLEERDWRLRKAATLVKLLALASGHRVHREQVVDLLWPTLEPAAAENNLHHTLHTARRVLDPSGATRVPRLDGAVVDLAWPAEVWTDVEAFERGLATARHSRDLAAYRRALGLYAGDLLLEDRFEDWAADRRVALHSLFVEALLEMALLAEDEGHVDTAIETLQRALSVEPALETAHVELMRLYARSGQRQWALRQYEQLRTALARELDAEPDAASRALYEDILAGNVPAVGTRRSASRPASSGLHNLPAPLSSFVGRDAMVADLLHRASVHRLLTLTGVAGAGKTRLAGVVARDLLPACEDGVWLIELAPVVDGGLVAHAVARVLSIEERSGEPLEDAMIRALRQKRLLLVLDNCEHVIDASARLAEWLLGSCPDLRILATSREPLNVAGEVTYSIPPLTLPDERQDLPLTALAETEAVRLFMERARLRQPAFTLTQDNAEAVARICRQVDGLPLAIELAASRIGVLSVEGIAERLADAPAFLTGGSRTSEPRQQSLRAALDWSYTLLSERERGLLRRLSVFAGGWSLEAAEAIDTRGDGAGESMLDLLSRLVDKSLVRADVATGDMVRYSMLEPVRQYARMQLAASGEVERAEREHAQFIAALTERAERELLGPHQARWFERLDREHDNLRAALRYAVAADGAEIGLRIMGASWRFWAGHGHGTEGRGWLTRLFALPSSAAAAPQTRAAALHTAGVLAYYQGDYGEAAAQYERELDLLRGFGDRQRIAIVLSNLALVVKEQGDVERARALHEEGLALAIEIGDERGQAANLNNLGILRQDLGDLESAVALHERALAIQRRLDDRRGIMITLNNLSAIALEQGAYSQAARHAEDALAIARDLGHVQSTIVALMNLGLVAVEEGDVSRSRERMEEAIRLLRPIGDKRRAAETLEYLARLACADGQYRRVAVLIGAAEGIRVRGEMEQAQSGRPRLVESVTTARQALGADAFEAAVATGRGFSMEDALAYALTREGEEAPAPNVPLTPREREIARLVTRGLTNRQIAERLTIAERTVDTHVRNILGKLGISSRLQIRDRLPDA